MDEAIKARLAELEQLIVPSKPGAEDIPAMNARNERMELLYQLAKRDEAEPGLRCTYTGLGLTA